MALGLTVGGFILKYTLWRKSNIENEEEVEDHHVINTSNTSINKKKRNKRSNFNFEYVAVNKDIGDYIFIYDMYI